MDNIFTIGMTGTQLVTALNRTKIYNVRDYGVIGNGITNDTAKIQELIEAIGAPIKVKAAARDLKYNSLITIMLGLKTAKINGATQAAMTKLDVIYPSCKGARRYDDLSKDAKEFIWEVEKRTGVPVMFIGTGPEALDLIDRR